MLGGGGLRALGRRRRDVATPSIASPRALMRYNLLYSIQYNYIYDNNTH